MNKGGSYEFAANWLSSEEYYNLLTNVDYKKCIVHPPVRAKPGEIYIVFNEEAMEDWKADQYRWEDRGMKLLPRNSPLIRCRYYYAADGSPFQRRAIILFKENMKYAALTLLHYNGCTKNMKILPHGNRKYNLDIPHIKTAKSVLDRQKLSLKQQPHNVYKREQCKDLHPALSKVLLPRDKKQVANTIYLERQKKLLSNDDILGVYLLSHELKDFIQHFVMVKYFHIVVFSHSAFEKFSNVTKFSDVILSYDTTFNMGDFFVSPLHYRHPLLQTKQEVLPVIPLAFLIHDRKAFDVHLSFFNVIKKSCPALDGITIVPDREAAINAAIKEALPKSHNFFCWNHIRRDVMFWLKKQEKSTKDDLKVYGEHIWDLLDSDSYESFCDKKRRMSLHWTEKFRKYFDTNLHDAIISSGKWVLIEFNKYTPRSGITTNAAECLNSVLKRCINHEEVNLQVMILTLYELDIFYQKEICRGLCNIGNYCLREKFKHLIQDPMDVDYPYYDKSVELDNLPYAFINKDLLLSNNTDRDRPFTNFSVAKTLVMKDCVRLLSKEQLFLISSIDNDTKKYIVTLFPRENCTCKAKSNCHHICAAKLSIGITEQTQKHVKLSKLLRKDRGHKAGRKFTPKNLTVVEGANDSLNNSSNKNINTILIPTITSNNSIVRSRFYDPDDDADAANESKLFQNQDIEEPTTCAITSTPKTEVRKKFTLQFDDTFTVKLKRNKQFLIFGRSIYPKHLDCLTITPDKSETDLYLFDSIMDVYIPILIHEEKKRNKGITIFSIDSIVINYMSDKSLEYGFKYFLDYRIPEYDIVFVPITYQAHCSLFMILKKQNIVVVLDSLTSPVCREDHLIYILRLYHAYNNFFSKEGPTFKIYIPKDVPKQNNGYDCSVFVCRYAETVIRQGNCSMDNMENYRNAMKQKILLYMENGLPGPERRFFNKTRYEQFLLPNWKPEFTIYYNNPWNGSTQEFLENIVSNI